MSNLKICIKSVKNITEANFDLPMDNGIYTFVGENGCGKSTIMLCMAQIVSNQWGKLIAEDVNANSLISFEIDTKLCLWHRTDGKGWRKKGDVIHLNGMYEGSLFYGTRFTKSLLIDKLIVERKIKTEDIVEADDYVKDKMSYILHGDFLHYRTLKRIRNRHTAELFKIWNIPYFIEVNNHLVSQYRMSSGECLLVSLLHFIYNSIERRSLPTDQTILVLIDELELALHPIAVLRLIDLLKELVKEHSNLVVYLSSHSPEVIKTIPPRNIYKVENTNGIIELVSNCYPSYLIRDLYCNESPDFLLLVEDTLAQQVVNGVLNKNNLRNSKLIHVVPVGGWQNVLELQRELYTKKILSTNTQIISILDGDVLGKLAKDQKKLPVLFLPIASVEKYLYSVIAEKKDPGLYKVIKDKYFLIDSLDSIVSEYNKGTKEGHEDNNKNFYRILLKSITKTGMTEQLFINQLCDDIINVIDFSSFISGLTRLI